VLGKHLGHALFQFIDEVEQFLVTDLQVEKGLGVGGGSGKGHEEGLRGAISTQTRPLTESAAQTQRDQPAISSD
jgi:hypothetical protein